MDQRPALWSFNVQDSRNLSPSEQEVSYLVGIADSMRGQWCGPWAPRVHCIRLKDQAIHVREGTKMSQEGKLANTPAQD